MSGIAGLLSIASMVAAAWPQPQIVSLDVVPTTPVGSFTIPAGTLLNVRVDETLSTNRSRPGDRFTGTLTDSFIVNGQTVVPPGTQVTGHILENRQAGVYKGQAQLVLGLDEFYLNGRSYPLSLTAATCQAEHNHKKLEDPDPNAGVVTGNREEATVPAEAVVSFTLGSPVRM